MVDFPQPEGPEKQMTFGTLIRLRSAFSDRAMMPTAESMRCSTRAS